METMPTCPWQIRNIGKVIHCSTDNNNKCIDLQTFMETCLTVSLSVHLSFLSEECMADSHALCVKNSYFQQQWRLSYSKAQCDFFSWTTDLTSFKILNCASNSHIQ